MDESRAAGAVSEVGGVDSVFAARVLLLSTRGEGEDRTYCFRYAELSICSGISIIAHKVI